MPQWDFLNFLRESGKRFASLKVMMSAEAVDLIRDGERIMGVKAKTPDGVIDIEADLTIACDGRDSLVRERAGLEVEEIGAPMVATANLLVAKLAGGWPSEDDLDAVRRRREFAVKMTQRMQVVVQNNIVNAALKPGHRPLKVPLVMRLVTAVPWLQGITARFVGLGVRPEHVQSAIRD
jgi:hypothetical protein